MLIQADARHIPLADGSVHCCVTSPPYWGLRDYGLAPRIFGGAVDCDHEWGDKIESAQRIRNGAPGGIHEGRNTNKLEEGVTLHPSQGAFCARCGAWRGCLGLEPTIDLYVQHIVDVFREVWRVLRDDGTFFLNIGDSYFGSSMTGGTKSKEGSEKRVSRMFTRPSSASHVKPCGTSDKEPEGCQESDCLCESLCDVCRKAYQIGKSHNDYQPAPTPVVLPCAPNRAHMVSELDHLPTLDSERQVIRNVTATHHSEHFQAPVDAPPHVVLESTIDESDQQPHETRSEVSTQGGECLLCGRSLLDSIPASERKLTCPCASRTSFLSTSGLPANTDDSGETDGSSVYHRSGKAYGLAYPHYTTASRQVQLKPKDLCMIPARVALALQGAGWTLRSDIIWSKPNPMPESVTDRPTTSHEHLFLLAKRERYYYDQEAIREPICEATVNRLSQPNFEQQQGGPKDPKNGNRSERRTLENLKERYTKQGVWEDRFEGYEHWKTLGIGRNRRTVWTIATQPFSGAHFATFPPALVEPCVRAGSSERGVCPVCGAPWVRVVERERVPGSSPTKNDANSKRYGGNGDRHDAEDMRSHSVATTLGWRPTCDHDAEPCPATVLDPFCGSGTTLAVAIRNGRRGVGLDLSATYLHDIAAPRLAHTQPSLIGLLA
jgi:DNA modification methylase